MGILGLCSLGIFELFWWSSLPLWPEQGGRGPSSVVGTLGSVMSEEMEHRGLDLKFVWVTVRPGAGLLTDGS